jgi:prophage DNA circulation protein
LSGSLGIAGAWLEQLQPASWRGLPFAVNSAGIKRGRRTAVHEYPWRDQVWVEDLGRGVRAVAFSAFVVGDDCFAQRDALLAAAETPGPGTLVHPSLGVLTVALVGPMEASERKDLGRVVEISFEAIETGLSIYPDGLDDTSALSAAAAGNLSAAAAGDFLSSIGSAVTQGAAVIDAGIRTASAYAAQVQLLAGDAALITGAVAGLPGLNGRYAGGARTTLQSGISTVPEAIAAVTASRAAIASGAMLVQSLAAGL